MKTTSTKIEQRIYDSGKYSILAGVALYPMLHCTGRFKWASSQSLVAMSGAHSQLLPLTTN